jgi:hypothetical protein
LPVPTLGQQFHPDARQGGSGHPPAK